MSTTETPYLIDRNHQKFCSACRKLIEATEDTSLSRAFVHHVRSEHNAALSNQPMKTNKP